MKKDGTPSTPLDVKSSTGRQLDSKLDVRTNDVLTTQGRTLPDLVRRHMEINSADESVIGVKINKQLEFGVGYMRSRRIGIEAPVTYAWERKIALAMGIFIAAVGLKLSRFCDLRF